MITEVQKRVNKELTLALSERARGEGALPTDLWKRAVSDSTHSYTRTHTHTHAYYPTNTAFGTKASSL